MRVVLDDGRGARYDVEYKVDGQLEIKVAASRVLPRLSKYKQLRLANIARNEARLALLGLGTRAAEASATKGPVPRDAPPFLPPCPLSERTRTAVNYAEPGDTNPLENNKENNSKAFIGSESNKEDEEMDCPSDGHWDLVERPS